ncbi:hypothetical protein BCV72DRAFT_241093 [Rhizopus microsporus var. microsporus]|uniref:Uncharacterized protein n=1 Tax=Rhizopus microsporus var. microsporus TaxID=86635 RepID=A0A1X0R6Z4_RHIZD|nr:hypothetical protein BCV72DRAFT_241093 [Rhizopus microsporus var. microsporus]
MVLTDELEQYKIPVVKEGSKHFFFTNKAKDWDFEAYFKSTHNEINKFKNIAKVRLDYDYDLNWITRLEEVPIEIKEYARALIEKKKRNKKQKLAGPTVVISGNMNEGTINNNSINNSEVRFTSDSSVKDKVLKRIYQEEKEGSDKEEEEQRMQVSGWTGLTTCEVMPIRFTLSEANNIIRSGNGISPNPNLDRDIYNKHMKNRIIKGNQMPQTFHTYIDKYVDSVTIYCVTHWHRDDLLLAKKVIKSLSLFLLTEKDNHTDTHDMEFLELLLQQTHKSFSSHIDYNTTEDAFNQLFVWPYLDIIGKTITLHNCKSDFVQGQPYLKSMSRQLQACNLYIDDKNQYKSDGLLKLFGLKELELLLETSGCLINKDRTKTNFDHHKGVFGTLAMLKCIADDYAFGSIVNFTKVKVFFLHAADRELHFWSVCYQKEDVFDLWRESSLLIEPDFQDKEDFVPNLIQFCWEVKVAYDLIWDYIFLKEEHDNIKRNYRYSSKRPVLLSEIINPIILKLTQEEDSLGMSKLGPIYSPPHP